MLNPTKSQIN